MDIHEKIKENPGEVLEKLIAEHGKDAILEAIVMKPKTGGSCDVGYHWDNVLHRCVLNGG